MRIEEIVGVPAYPVPQQVDSKCHRPQPPMLPEGILHTFFPSPESRNEVVCHCPSLPCQADAFWHTDAKAPLWGHGSSDPSPDSSDAEALGEFSNRPTTEQSVTFFLGGGL